MAASAPADQFVPVRSRGSRPNPGLRTSAMVIPTEGADEHECGSETYHKRSQDDAHLQTVSPRKRVHGSATASPALRKGSKPFTTLTQAPVCATQTDEVIEKLHHNFRAAVLRGLTVAVDEETNNPLVWGAIRSNLTWSCETDDIEEFADDIAKAFKSWSDTCNVVFKKVDKDGFITVRWANDDEEAEGQGVIAAAFFPGEEDRSIKLYQLYKEQGDFRISVLRHEIGHALGFRHEHIWFKNNPTGERISEGGMGAKLLTKKDPQSIMNYNKLWADSAKHIVSDLSDLDKIGSRLLYGAPASVVHFLM